MVTGGHPYMDQRLPVDSSGTIYEKENRELRITLFGLTSAAGTLQPLRRPPQPARLITPLKFRPTASMPPTGGFRSRGPLEKPHLPTRVTQSLHGIKGDPEQVQPGEVVR